MVSFDPVRKDFTPYGLTCVRWSPTLMPRPDRHNEIELNLIVGGTLTYLLGGQRVEIPPRRLSVFWAAIPHQIVRFEVREPYFVMTLPLALFLQWRLPDAFLQAILHGRVVTETQGARFEGDRLRFEEWRQDLRSRGEERKRPCLLEVEARLQRLAAPFRGGRPSRRGPHVLGEGRLSRVEEMAGYIARNYTRPLAVAEIAGHAGLHPNYAMNLFRRTFGTTVLAHLLQHRLAHAQRLLATTDALVVEVALDSGFGSLSRFNEAFRRAFGCTPREYRRQHRLA